MKSRDERKLIFFFKWKLLFITVSGAEPGNAKIYLCIELVYTWI